MQVSCVFILTCKKKVSMVSTTPLMVFSVTCTICEGPKLDVSRLQRFMSTNCQYDTISQNK